MEENPFLTRRYLAAKIAKYGWTIGDHSYGLPSIMDENCGGLAIGRFCSIAMHVTLILGNHRLDGVSTYPFRSFFGFWPGSEHCPSDHEDRGGIVIGNDVLISKGVTILPGSRIRDGAVLGADTVISGTVDPYAIMVGNPARRIRKRFDDATIERLLEIAWWDWPDHAVKENIALIAGRDVGRFIARFDLAERRIPHPSVADAACPL